MRDPNLQIWVFQGIKVLVRFVSSEPFSSCIYKFLFMIFPHL